MAITYDLTGPDKDRLNSWHWLHFPGADDAHLYTLTGVVRVEFRGTSGDDWRREEITLILPFPEGAVPDGQVLQVDYFTPSVHLSSVFNDNQAVNAGWAVNAFSGPGRPQIRSSLTVRVQAAVRDAEGVVFSLGFDVAVAGRFVDAPEEVHVRVRRDVWKLPEWDPVLLWYARAIAEMKTRPLDDPTSWRYQAAIHDYVRAADPLRSDSDSLPSATEQSRFWAQCQHFSWFFLPWHRIYLGYFEQIVSQTIQQLGGPSDWALPYWNYSDDGNPSQARRLPPAFRAAQTPDGEDNPLRVDDRRAAANAGQVIAQDLHVDLSCLLEPTFGGAAAGPAGFGGPAVRNHNIPGPVGALERTPHGDMHVRVGGWMSRFNTAALDPIFWLHHANIDRQWTVWKKRRPGQHVDPTGAGWLSEPFDFHNASGAIRTLTSAEVADSEASPFAYRYEDESDPLPAEEGPGALESLTMSRPPSDEPVPEMVGATEAPIRLGRQGASARVPLSAPRGPGLEALAAPTPPRIHLNIENIRGSHTTPYRVYVNVPEGDAPEDHPELLAGSLPMFGLHEASGGDPEHAPSGLTYAFDVTAIARRLGEAWNPNELRVTFVRDAFDDEEERAALEAPEPPPIEVGRVSVYQSR